MRKCVALILCLMLLPACALAANPEPVLEFESLLNENGITLQIPQMNLNRRDDDDWYYCQIAERFNMIYDVYHDGSKDMLMLQPPDTWRPQRDAFLLLIEYMLGMDSDEAESTLASLEYNVIGNSSEIVTEKFKINYMEANTFCSLTVTRYPAQ